MDDDPPGRRTASVGRQQDRSLSQFPQPTIRSPRLSSSTTSSQDSQALYVRTHVHPPELDMDSVGDARRRRALLMNHPNGSIADTLKDTKDPRRHRRKQGDILAGEDGHRHTLSVTEDGQESEFSLASTSDDVELDHLSSDQGLTDDEETGLTKKGFGKRKRKRRRPAQLDERIAETPITTKGVRSAADKNVVKALIMNALLIASWYTFSLSISIYNKWMFSDKYLDFHFPLFTTCMHMLVQFTLASLVLYFVPHLRPRVDSITNPQNHNDVQRDSLSKTEKPLMTRMFYLTRIGPCGAATGLDIGLGNMSLRFITLTFFTMCKSSSLAFILLFAFIFRLEQPSWKLVLIIGIMTIGVIMMVAGETAFNALGFILIISASFFSGFRWALTQILLLRNPATSNPFSSIFFLAPVMFVVLFILAAPIEGFGPLAAGIGALAEKEGALKGVGILLFPGVLAFLMTASEFALLKRTSVVTLSICGIFKEVVTISAAGIVFHDPLTPINISGLVITIASIAAYNYMKITKMRKVAEIEAAKSKEGESEAAEPMLHDHDGHMGETTPVPSSSPHGGVPAKTVE